MYSSYGGIAQIENNILYMSGDSDLIFNQRNELKKINLILQKSIRLKLIIKKLFIKKNEFKVGKNAEKYFGIKDIIIENFTNFDNPLLIASSLEYNESEDCYTVGVYFAKNFRQ